MSGIRNRINVRIVCCAIVGLLPVALANGQNGGQRKTLSQSSADVAALPVAGSQSNGGIGQPRFQQPGRSTNPQAHSASPRTGVYDYPAGPPRGFSSAVGYRVANNNFNAQLPIQGSLGVANGNQGSRTQAYRPQGYRQPPVYNVNTAASVGSRTGASLARRITNSRSPVEQQVSSTMPLRQIAQRQSLGGNNGGAAPSNSITAARQAQSQAIQLSQQAQAQQAQAQQTLVQAQQAQVRAAQLAQASQPLVRQTVYQQSTLGLGGPLFRTAQNCNCTPGYNPAAAAYQAPALNPNVGAGLALAPQNFQPNSATRLGFGQPNYQLPAGVGTPQFGAQGARWWTPFVSGSGVYTPLLKLQNMPVGTYLGQGVIGQPTAYVDGQPVRNLLRYISP